MIFRTILVPAPPRLVPNGPVLQWKPVLVWSKA